MALQVFRILYSRKNIGQTAQIVKIIGACRTGVSRRNDTEAAEKRQCRQRSGQKSDCFVFAHGMYIPFLFRIGEHRRKPDLSNPPKEPQGLSTLWNGSAHSGFFQAFRSFDEPVVPPRIPLPPVF